MNCSTIVKKIIMSKPWMCKHLYTVVNKSIASCDHDVLFSERFIHIQTDSDDSDDPPFPSDEDECDPPIPSGIIYISISRTITLETKIKNLSSTEA